MEFEFVWTNHSDEWRAITGPGLGAGAFAAIGIAGFAASLPQVGLVLLGVATICLGLLVPQLGSRQGETVRIDGDGVRIGQTSWWKHSATYGLSGLFLAAAGLVTTAWTGWGGAPVMLVLGAVLGVCVLVLAVVLWWRRGDYIVYPDRILTPRGRTIAYDRLAYRLYEPPRGARSVEVHGADGIKPGFVTAFGYMINPSTVISTLDALTAGDRRYTPREIRAMLMVRSQPGVAEGESVVVRLPSDPAWG